jgi:hypothetical protein
MSDVRLRVISLGAGVQSTTMYLMACQGDLLPRPDVAIFADTGWEPLPVYAHLQRLRAEWAHVIPILIVSRGNIRRDMTDARGRQSRFATMPLYIHRPDKGGTSMIRRQCTKEYKIEPIRRAVHRLVRERGIPKRSGVVEQWIGISADEAQRMKGADVKYIRHHWPLIDQGMTRADCSAWLTHRGYTPRKSSCVGCPFHDDEFWLDMKLNRPEEFADAAAFDAEIRQLPRLTHPTFLHRTLLPLADVPLEERVARARLRRDRRNQPDLWDGFSAECEGMCGV